jgi:hypothetical protein
MGDQPYQKNQAMKTLSWKIDLLLSVYIRQDASFLHRTLLLSKYVDTFYFERR